MCTQIKCLMIDEWMGRSVDTQKMAMQVEPRWAIWVDNQRNQAKRNCFGLIIAFRFSEICVRSNTSKIRMNITNNFSRSTSF